MIFFTNCWINCLGINGANDNDLDIGLDKYNNDNNNQDKNGKIQIEYYLFIYYILEIFVS